jgi:hypothetical protein
LGGGDPAAAQIEMSAGADIARTRPLLEKAMSGRVKIKSKVVKATLANKDVLDMFHGVLGTSEGATTLSITHPKYLRIQSHVDRFIRLLTALKESRLMSLFPGPKEHLDGYTAALRGQFAASFNAPDFSPWVVPDPGAEAPGAAKYAQVPAEVVAQFNEVFAAAKKCSVVNTVIVTCKNLVTHKKSLADSTALKDRFLTKGAGMTFCPFPDLPQLNFKQIYIDDRLSPGDKEFVLIVLHKAYTIGHDLYEAVSAPDVDVSEFVEVIMSSIGEVKKHIPRCDQAFQKIIESVDLLKGNFNGYYKDYAASGNPTIIMENFVLDVSKNTQSTPTITAQFRRIIAHYRKLASQQASHPKLQTLFQQVDANFQELEKKSKEADTAGDSDESGSDDSSSPAPPAAPKVSSAAKAARNRRRKANMRAKAAAAKAPGAAAKVPGADAVDAGADAVDAGADAVDAGADAVDAGADAVDAVDADAATDAESDAGAGAVVVDADIVGADVAGADAFVDVSDVDGLADEFGQLPVSSRDE